MDIESIEPSEDFVDVINRDVDQCQVMLAVIGPSWLTVSDNFGQRRLDDPNDFVRLEISRALLEQRKATEAQDHLNEVQGLAQAEPQIQARNKMLWGWLVDLEGDAEQAKALLGQAEALLGDVTPEQFMCRELEKYRETRMPGGAGGTMLWAMEG